MAVDRVGTDLIEKRLVHHVVCCRRSVAQRIRTFHAASAFVVAVFKHVFILGIYRRKHMRVCIYGDEQINRWDNTERREKKNKLAQLLPFLTSIRFF